MRLAIAGGMTEKTDDRFDRHARRVGRALVRRRRVRVLDLDLHVACVEVRAPEGNLTVVIFGKHLCACECDGGAPDARCGHAYAAVLARNRLLSGASDRGADLEDGVDGLAREEIA